MVISDNGVDQENELKEHQDRQQGSVLCRRRVKHNDDMLKISSHAFYAPASADNLIRLRAT